MKFIIDKLVVGGIVGVIVVLIVIVVVSLDCFVYVVVVMVSVLVFSGLVNVVQLGSWCVQVVFVGGCFWGVQGVFQYIKGVNNVVFGYIGGNVGIVSYVCVGSGIIGYVEVVQVIYDLSQVSYVQLMQVFFLVVYDFIQFNWQGFDQGIQYCLVIYIDDLVQCDVICVYIVQLECVKVWVVLVVIQVDGGKCFFVVEDYYQNYFILYLELLYICINDLFKVEVLKYQYLVLYCDILCLVLMLLVC